MEQAPSQGPVERPLGVTILAVLAGIGGVMAILGGIFLGSVVQSYGFGAMMAGVGGSIMVVMGLVNLVIAYGLWSGFSWAWWLTVIFTGLNALMSLLSLNIIGLIIAAIILWYMMQGHVKGFFNVS